MTAETSRTHRHVPAGLHLALALGFLWAYPRLLEALLGAANPWAGYFYQYGAGLGLMMLGLWLGVRTRSCRPECEPDALCFLALAGGFVLFAAVHALVVAAALAVPVRGD